MVLRLSKVIQSIIFGSNHLTHPNQLKGSKAVLQKCGLWRAGLLTKCKKDKSTGAKCTSNDYCAWCILQNQPDFTEHKSLIQENIESMGHYCLFLPKYHCELNFIEQCWSYAKQIYRMFPTSSKEEDLERNMNAALDAVPIETMRK